MKHAPSLRLQMWWLKLNLQLAYLAQVVQGCYLMYALNFNIEQESTSKD